MIRILIVNDSKLTGGMVACALEDEPNMEIVATATTIEEAKSYLRRGNIDLALISSRMPEYGAMDLINHLQDSEVKIVLMGLSEPENQIMEYIEAGIEGYVLRDGSVEDLVKAINFMDKKEAQIPPGIAYDLMSRVAELSLVLEKLNSKELIQNEELTSREKDVLKLIEEGHTNKEISDKLVIEIGTVKNHVHNILSKLNVGTREEAASFFALIKARKS